MPNGQAVIESESQYDDWLARVSKSSQTAVGKFNTGQALDDNDKATSLENAKILDNMSAYRPDMAAGYFEAGLLYYLAGDTDTAFLRINQSIQDAWLPGNIKMTGDKEKIEAVLADCHHMLSMIQFDRHQYQKAFDEANLAIKQLSTRPTYYVARANAEVQLSKVADAKKDLAQALKLDPACATALRLDKFLKS